MCRLVVSLVAAVSLSACAKQIDVAQYLDAAMDPGAPSSPSEPNGAGPQPEPHSDDGGRTKPSMDGSADAPDGGPSPHLGPPTCMNRIEDQIQVPVPSGSAFQRIDGIAFDAQRRLYVTGQGTTGFVQVLASPPSLALIRTLTPLPSSRDVAADSSSNVYGLSYEGITAGEIGMVIRFDSNGNPNGSWSANGGGQKEAYSLLIDPMGRVNIGGLIIYRYALDGTPIDSFGSWGGQTGMIGSADGLAWDPRGYLWIADLGRNMIHQFDPVQGTQVVEIGGRGPGPARFDGEEAPDVHWGPTRLAIDGDGNIYANDPFASRIQKLSRQGVFLGDFSFGGSRQIGAIAIDPATGILYVAQTTEIDVICPW